MVADFAPANANTATAQSQARAGEKFIVSASIEKLL